MNQKGSPKPTRERFIDIETYLKDNPATKQTMQKLRDVASLESFQRFTDRTIRTLCVKHDTDPAMVHSTTVRNSDRTVCTIITTLERNALSVANDFAKTIQYYKLESVWHEIICNGKTFLMNTPQKAQ